MILASDIVKFKKLCLSNFDIVIDDDSALQELGLLIRAVELNEKNENDYDEQVETYIPTESI
jgi:hypothetical protein